MTAPVLAHKKFYIIKPYGGYNYLKNPAFVKSAGASYWTAANASIEITDEEQRRGAYSLKVIPNTGTNAYITYAGLAVTAGLAYTFSCDIKGVAGQAMRIYINAMVAKTFTATGYWQREQVTAIMGSGVTQAYVVVQRDSVASTEPFYVDGVQFEQTTEMTTFMEGYQEGCGWSGLPYHSVTWRDPLSAAGGLLVDLEDYCDIVSVTGLGHGNWNQILTKMTTGGDMYQTHIRKSKQFSIIVDFIGDSLGEIESKRKALIEMLRPDLVDGERIIRYQGFDDNGKEATQPVDIICVPLEDTLIDTPELPSHQRAVLNFTIPSGLPQGAYNEGCDIEVRAEATVGYIVKRDQYGNWVAWNGSTYVPKITALNGIVYCMAEAPNGDIYVGGMFTNAGGVANADYIARWNLVTGVWEAVGNPNSGTASITYVKAMIFDAAGNLYVGGNFDNLADVALADNVAKWDGTNWTALGNGLNNTVETLDIDYLGYLYAGGQFNGSGATPFSSHLAYFDSSTGAWTNLSGILDSTAVWDIKFAPNRLLYVGHDRLTSSGNFISVWNGSDFYPVGDNSLNGYVKALEVLSNGKLVAGGRFTNASGNADADYIAEFNGHQWLPLGNGLNNPVSHLYQASSYKVGNKYYAPKLYAAGYFTKAGGITLTDKIAAYSGGVWHPLDIDFPGTASVYSILQGRDGSLYIGGDFNGIGVTGLQAQNAAPTSSGAKCYPHIKLRGPGVLSSIYNYSNGKQIFFNDLTLLADETLDINLDPLDIYFRSSWRGNMMGYIAAGSDYGNFYLDPGQNYIYFFMPSGTTAATGGEMTWTPKFWGLDGALLQ